MKGVIFVRFHKKNGYRISFEIETNKSGVPYY